MSLHHLLERLKRQLAVLQLVVSKVQRQEASNFGNLLFGGAVYEAVRQFVEGFEVGQVVHRCILRETRGGFEDTLTLWRTHGALSGKNWQQFPANCGS